MNDCDRSLTRQISYPRQSHCTISNWAHKISPISEFLYLKVIPARRGVSYLKFWLNTKPAKAVFHEVHDIREINRGGPVKAGTETSLNFFRSRKLTTVIDFTVLFIWLEAIISSIHINHAFSKCANIKQGYMGQD